MHAHALCARARTLSAHACTLRVCGRSSGALYSKEISSWLQKYGFKPTSVDETLFKLQRGNDIILLSLYVDDGACATNSEALYQQFIKDLQAKYKLSDQGDLKWHLSMKIARDANTGAIIFNQRAYIEHVLKPPAVQHGERSCQGHSAPATHPSQQV